MSVGRSTGAVKRPSPNAYDPRVTEASEPSIASSSGVQSGIRSGVARPVLGADRSVVIALVVAILLLLQPGRPGGETLLTLALLGGVLALAVARPASMAAPVAIAALLVVGVALRAGTTQHAGSDVLDVTIAAIQRATSGLNPYGIGYEATRPPGAPYPYGPLALLWYAPIQDEPWQIELVMACVVLALLAMRGKLLGLAVYALGPTLVATAVDGSNDSSAGVLILIAFLAARQRPLLGAVLLAAAVAFKPYAAAWAPAYLLWAGVAPAVAFVVASLALWSPVLFPWGIGSFLTSLRLANEAHHLPFWSLGDLLEDAMREVPPEPLLDGLRLVLGAVTALVTLRWARSLDGVILAGTAVYLVTLFAGFWGTYAYFGAIAPILCWRIDDWLGLRSFPLVDLPIDRFDTSLAASEPAR